MEVRASVGIRRRIRGITCAALVMCVAGTAARAEQAAPSYESVVERLDALPVAREAAALYDAALGRADQAATRPNPIVAVETENALGTGAYTGYRRADTTLSISQPLELWGQRGARIDAARADVDVVELRLDHTRLAAAGRLAQAYAEAEAAARRYDLAQEARVLAEEDGDAARALVDEGREPELRAIQAESEVQAARAVVAEAQANRTAAFAWLAAVARLERTPDSVPPDLLERVPAGTASIAGEPLTVRLADAERRAVDRLVMVERLRARPALSATVGVQRLEETNDAALAFGVSVTVPLFDRNRGAITAALAERRAAEARLDMARDEAIAQRRAADANLTASADRTQAADSAVAAAEEAYRRARIGFEAGRISQLELRASRAGLVATENAAVDARLARVRAEIDLARLDGRVPFGGVR